MPVVPDTGDLASRERGWPFHIKLRIMRSLSPFRIRHIQMRQPNAAIYRRVFFMRFVHGYIHHAQRA